MESKKHTIIYDGGCNLCNGVVDWIQKYDPSNQFEYVPFQSEFGQEVLMNLGLPTNRLDTVILIKEEITTKSKAFLEIMKKLKYWKYLGFVFQIIPIAIRDSIYVYAAKNRVKWFGIKNENCTISYDFPLLSNAS